MCRFLAFFLILVCLFDGFHAGGKRGNSQEFNNLQEFNNRNKDLYKTIKLLRTCDNWTKVSLTVHEGQSIVEHMVRGKRGLDARDDANSKGGHFFTTKDAIEANEQKIILENDDSTILEMDIRENDFRELGNKLAGYFDQIWNKTGDDHKTKIAKVSYEPPVNGDNNHKVKIFVNDGRKYVNITSAEFLGCNVAGSSYKHIQGFIICVAKYGEEYKFTSVAPLLWKPQPAQELQHRKKNLENIRKRKH